MTTAYLAKKQLPQCKRPGCDRTVFGHGLDVCTSDVPWRLGITYRQLTAWARAGYLHPVSDGDSTGYAQTWPETELDIARRMGPLADAGL